MSLYLEWLLEVATNARHHFIDSDVETQVKEIVRAIAPKHDAICVTDMNINKVAPIVVIVREPRAMIEEIVNTLKRNQNVSNIRPIMLFTKLVDREFSLEIASERMIYFIRSSTQQINEACVRAMICRNVLSIGNWESNIDDETKKLNDKFFNNLVKKMDDDRCVDGGRVNKEKKPVGNKQAMMTKRSLERVEIIKAIQRHALTTDTLKESLIFVSSMDQLDARAMDVIITDYRAKDAVIKFIREHIPNNHGDYKVILLNRNEFEAPGDFRMTKFTIAAKHSKTQQMTYLINMYNCGLYDPIPCHPDEGILQAHPLVQLRILYLDQYATGLDVSQKILERFNQLIQHSIKACKAFSGRPYWAGYLRDEANDRNRENMRHQQLLVNALL